MECELVAAVVVANEALVGELGQGGADGGGAQAAELAQTLNGDGFLYCQYCGMDDTLGASP